MPDPGRPRSRHPLSAHARASSRAATTTGSITFGTALRRGLIRHCAHCGSGHLFRRWFTMRERCPGCGLKLERVEGHWTGALGINTIVVFGAILMTVFAGVFATWPEPQMVPMVVVGLLLALVGPFVFFPFSKTIWLAIDIAIRPVEDSELVVDPAPSIVADV